MSDETKPEQPAVNQPSPTPQPIQAQLNRLPGNIKIDMDKVDEVAAWLVKSRAPENYAVDVPFTVVPDKMTVLDLEKHMPRPKRIMQDLVVTDVESFIEYYRAFKDGASPRLFAMRSQFGIGVLCVFDYHEKAGEPRWGDHTLTLNLQYHPDYEALLCPDNWFSQRDFALFVEQNIHVFRQPTGGEMLEIAQQLKGSRKADWKTGKRLSDGTTSLEYVETNVARSQSGELIVPEYLEMETPIFEGFEPKNIRAAFSWDMKTDSEGAGKVMFNFRLLTKLQEREAEEQVKQQIVDQTGQRILNVKSFGGLL